MDTRLDSREVGSRSHHDEMTLGHSLFIPRERLPSAIPLVTNLQTHHFES